MTIVEEFSRYKIKKKVTSMKDKFSLQKHQRFLKAYVSSPHFDDNNRLLLYHGLGSGKTCSAITIASAFKKKHGSEARIITVTPASLIPNFKNEVGGLCGFHNFPGLSGLKPTELSKSVNTLFNVMSYQKFVNSARTGIFDNFDEHTLLIIDEVQNIISLSGITYKVILNLLSATKTSLVILSGTPLFDDSRELGLIANLLTKTDKMNIKGFRSKFKVSEDINGETSVNNRDFISNFFKNKVSFFRGNDQSFYPSVNEFNVYCKMSKFQYEGYLKSLGETKLDFEYDDMSNAFLCGPRTSSNVVFPDGSISVASAKKYLDKSVNAKKHAIKFHTCVIIIKKAAGPMFVYSNFVNSGGVNTFCSMLLSQYSFEEYLPRMGVEKGKALRFAVFRSGEPENNCAIIKSFNSIENKDGGVIKAIVGSPAMREGCTLLRTRAVHILDPYWNLSRTKQIIGRAVRYCSHTDLPSECQKVSVYHYIAVSPHEQIEKPVVPALSEQPEMDPEDKSVDVHIMDMAKRKSKSNAEYEAILKEVAIDCELFINANQPPEYTCKNNDLFAIKPPSVTTEVKVVKSNVVKVKIPKAVKLKSSEPIERGSENNEATKAPEALRMKFGVPKKNSNSNVKKVTKKGCPKARQVSDDTCPQSHPFQRENKHGVKCCYKKRNEDSIVNKIMKKSKPVLLAESRAKGYTGPSVPKKKLCEFIINN